MLIANRGLFSYKVLRHTVNLNELCNFLSPRLVLGFGQSMSDSWLYELSGLVASSAYEVPGLKGEIRIKCGELARGIELGTGALSSGDAAVAEMKGDEASLSALVRGEISLQSAFRSGALELTGQPELFLRLSMILDRRSNEQTVAAA